MKNAHICVCLVSSTLCAIAPVMQGQAPAPTNVPPAAAAATIDRETWNRTTLVGAYESIGKKNEKWDASVREALEIASRLWVAHPRIEGDENTRIAALCQQATIQGCDDPIMFYAHQEARRQLDRDDIDERRLSDRCVKQIEPAGYHSIYKCLAYLRNASLRWNSKLKPGQATREEVQRLLGLAAKEFPIAVRDKNVPRSYILETCEQYMDLTEELTGDRLPAFQKLDADMAAAGVDESTRLTIKGEFYTSYAWDARGSGWASTVTEEGWKLFHERLKEAGAALTRAWTLDPKNSLAATEMLTVELGEGEGRTQLDLWFSRAMIADPDNYEACSSKLYYLEPKWRGSWQEMLDFGHECAKTGHWAGKIPFILIQTHERFAREFHKTKQGDYKDYFKRPGVWEDIKSVYEPYLKLHPKAAKDRGKYARFACWSGDWAEGHRQFEILGTNVVLGAFENRAEYEYLRKDAAEKKDSNPAAATPGK